MNATTEQSWGGNHIAEESNEVECEEDIDLSIPDAPTTQQYARRVIPPDIDVHDHEQLSFTITVRLRETRLQRELSDAERRLQDVAGAYPDERYQDLRTTISRLPTLPKNVN